jgi:hypothetical protein
MTTLTLNQQQLANNLQAVEQEKLNIAELEATLATTKDAEVKKVLKYRIKICKDFHRRYMLTAQSLQRSLMSK